MWSFPLSTIAQREMERLRSNYPPHGGERVLAVWGSKLPLDGSLGSWFKRELNGRTVAIGEVGLPNPDAYTKHYGDNSSLVVVSSTFVDFVEAVSLILAGGAIMATAHEADVAATLSGEQTAERLVAWYRQWSEHGVRRGAQIRARYELLPDKASSAAARLASEIIFFVLMHEFGHAVLHAGVPPEEHSPAQEYEADRWALNPAVIGLRGMKQDSSYGAAGAAVGLRVLWGIEKMGHHFAGSHPPARHRIAHVRQEWRKFLKSDALYFRYTSAAYAFEEGIAGAEALMEGSRPVLTAHRLVARIISCLEMLLQGEIRFEDIRDVFARDLDRGADAVVARAASILGRVIAENTNREFVRAYEDLLSSQGLPVRVAMFRSAATAQE
jgi:hypothetical protein